MHVFTAKVGSGDAALAVLFAQHSAGQSLEGLFEALYTDHADARQQAACIVLRPDVRDRFKSADLADALAGTGADTGSAFLGALRAAMADPALAFARMVETPIVILFTTGETLHVSDNISPLGTAAPFAARGLTEQQVLCALRERELDILVERSRALLPVIPGSFYLAPSDRLARAFLRVGNIQYSRHAIDAVCFWLLPHMHGCRAILVDTWSISSIAFDLAGLVGAMRGGPPLPVEMLSEYQDGSAERMALAVEALGRLAAELRASDPADGTDAKVKVACVLSATHTGSLVNVLNDMVELSGLPLNLSYIALFQMGPDLGLPSLRDISGTSEFRPLEPSEEMGPTIVEVDPQCYFPLSHNDVELAVRVRHAQQAKAFVEAFPEAGLISVHRDHKTDGPSRHHAFHIDTQMLIRSQRFREKFAGQLRALDPRPSIIVTPLHPAAHELGQFAASVLGADGPVEHYEHSNLTMNENGPDRDADRALQRALLDLDENEAILVLDDAFITGTRMTGYQNRLRASGCKARFHFHVAIARPAALSNWRGAKSMLGWRDPAERAGYVTNTVDATYELCLPNWQGRDCPWCAELQRYDAVVESGTDLPAFFVARRTRLVEGKETGLIADAVLQDGYAAPLRLERGSIFAPDGLSQATAFAAVASALQTMRTVVEPDLPRLGPRRHPLSTVLKATEYLLDTYTDSVVRAAFLRGATADELMYADRNHEAERQRLIDAIVASPEHHVSDLGHELILAAALGKGALSQAAKNILCEHAGRREALEILQPEVSPTA